MALVQTPESDRGEPKAWREKMEASIDFICEQTAHPLMSFEDYDAGYDTRGWGYTYGLLALCELSQANLVPERLREKVAKAMQFYLDGIEQTQIPEVGGWNYARPPGKDKPAAPSTFMTPPTVQALWAAKARGMKVQQSTIDKALAFMQSSIAPADAVGGKDAGSVTYSGPHRAGRREQLPGATGRMCTTEATLAMAGMSSPARLRRAVESFINHWDELEKRRQMSGTHVGPYGVAPYYFMFAHHAAAQACELLPAADKAELRAKCDALLFRVRAENGSWNDRVFARSSAYGTAMAMMSLMGPKTYEGKSEQKAE